ncbi:unnamed protein product [Prorocentrum cordatum]|nr:unnamed protein product [Polarella glacialis]
MRQQDCNTLSRPKPPSYKSLQAFLFTAKRLARLTDTPVGATGGEPYARGERRSSSSKRKRRRKEKEEEDSAREPSSEGPSGSQEVVRRALLPALRRRLLLQGRRVELQERGTSGARRSP